MQIIIKKLLILPALLNILDMSVLYAKSAAPSVELRLMIMC